jgi:hypothetical protein
MSATENRHSLASVQTVAVPELSLAAVLISSAFAFNGNQARQARSQSPGNRLAVQNVPFMARALGLGRSSDDPYLQLRKKLKPHSDCHQTWIPSALLPIGYSMGRFGLVRREPLANVVHEDHGSALPRSSDPERQVSLAKILLNQRSSRQRVFQP